MLGKISQALSKGLEERRGLKGQASQTSQCSKKPCRHNLKIILQSLSVGQTASECILGTRIMPDTLIPRLWGSIREGFGLGLELKKQSAGLMGTGQDAGTN